MIKSMTGYGKAEAVLPSGKLTIEIRSLNSKNADISIKSQLLPKEKELAIRNKIAESLVRGSIDVFLDFEANSQAGTKIIDEELVKAYYKQLVQIRTSLPSSNAESDLLPSILRFPDILNSQTSNIIDEEDWPVVETAFDEALESIDEYRTKEGAALYKDITSRIRNILNLQKEVELHEPERLQTVKENILKAAEECGIKLEPERFEQEMVFYLQKLDISEEQLRLRQHCKYFLDTIDSEPCPGKKLGFIIQEIGREINTTGSKANNADIQKAVVKMKDELEKIREQSLNIL
jgi:uncharacterized protein (TIGR00255 family)